MQQAADLAAAPRHPAPEPPAALPLAGTTVHPVTQDDATDLIVALADQDDAALVVTPNVDHVVLLRRDARLRCAYDRARLRLVDGAPLVALSRLAGRPVPERVTGADLFPQVCEQAAREGKRIFIAGGAPDVLRRGIAELRGRFPGLEISGHSPPPGFEGTDDDVELQRRIAAANPDIVAVCLGAPRAEIWAAQQQERHPAVYLCVGAAIDFAAGARRRAPRLVQRAGLEWLFRLLQEPRRLWRRYLVQDAAFLPIAVREIVRTRVLRRHGA